jgi:rsbT antagonist protein RsbS
MEVPILRQGNYLITTIQAALSDAALLKLQDELVERVGFARAGSSWMSPCWT